MRTKVLRSLLLGSVVILNHFALFAQQPNIVVIICDDLNDAVGDIGGHPQAITPHINALQQEGVTFTNAQSNAPLCGPSRASLWSGVYPHNSGFYGANQEDNQWQNNPTLGSSDQAFSHFREHGYGVYATGKIYHHDGWHLHNGLYDEFNIGQSFGPYPWDGSGAPSRDGHPDMPSSLNSWTDIYFPLSQVPSYPGYTGWVDQGEEFHYVDETDRDPLSDERNTTYAQEVFEREHEKPFFLTVGYNNPHNPFVVPDTFYNMYPLESLQLAPRLENDRDDVPESMKSSLYWYYTGTSKYDKLETLGLSETDPDYWFKRWTQGYLACVSFVDNEIGKLMAALKASAYADNTIVILTSDHGYHMREKDAFFKYTLWEESCRIPLVAWGSGVEPGLECSHPVSLIDMYPTLVDLGSLDNPTQDLDGHSLVPFFQNPEDGIWDGPSVALSTVADNNGSFPNNEPQPAQQQNYSVRSERYRYIVNNVGDEELYDHELDPHEWNNVACEIAYAGIKAELREQLIALTGITDMTLGNGCGYHCSVPDLGENQSICGENSIELNSSFPSGSGVSYSWYQNGVLIPGAQHETYEVLEEGIYKVQVDSGVCSTTSEVHITTKNSVVLDLGPDISLCSPATAVIAGGLGEEYMYQWFKNDQTIIGQDGASLEVASAGVYRLEASQSGCAPVTDVVVVSSGIEEIGHDTLCEPSEAALFVVSNEQVTWYDEEFDGADLENGLTFSPFISESTTFYVGYEFDEHHLLADIPMNEGWASDGTNGTWGQPFELLTAVRFESFQVTVDNASSLSIDLLDGGGSSLFTTTYSGLEEGVTTLDVGIELGPGNYSLVTEPVGTLHTTANNEVTFPIESPGIAVINSTLPSWLAGNGRLAFVHDLLFTTKAQCDRVPVSAMLDENSAACIIADVESAIGPSEVFPNPCNDELFVPSHWTNLELIGVAGDRFKLSPLAGAYDMSSIPPGVYSLKAQGDTYERYQLKIVKF